MTKVKNVLVGLCLLFSVGCGAQWSELPDAVEPVAEHALPFAGTTLIQLSASFYALCPVDRPRGEACEKAKAALNAAVEQYNRVNNFVEYAY